MADTAATVRLAAAASIALQQLLAGPRQSGTLLGVSEHATWIGVGEEVVVLSDRQAVRLPNAIELAEDDVGRWINEDDAAYIGDGSIAIGRLTAVARRWFDPRPVLGSCRNETLERNLAMTGNRVAVPVDSELLEALRGRDQQWMLDRATNLLGKGEGLTPEGDDIIAGAIASHLLLAGAVGRSTGYLDAFTEPLNELSRTRTTSFSASLIRHASAGRVSTPFANLLKALTGRGGLEAATEELLAVGHTSGPALVGGILVGGLALSLENAS
jgi:hypothetical protein